jgi:hypothetical protein
MSPLLDASMVIDLILTLAISVYSTYFPFLKFQVGIPVITI